MERLKKKDAEAGVERQPVTDAHKAAIAEIRNFYESKLAELEVLHQAQMLTSVDPGERATAWDRVLARLSSGRAMRRTRPADPSRSRSSHRPAPPSGR